MPLDAPSDDVPNLTENEGSGFKKPGTVFVSPATKGRRRKGNLRRLIGKKYTEDGEEDEMMDEDNEDNAISSGSVTEDDLSGDEEVTFKGHSASKKKHSSKSPGYQRRERFLSGRDFFHLPFLRAFATGPSPAVEDREEPTAYFYCRICRIDISTDKTFSRTPAVLPGGISNAINTT